MAAGLKDCISGCPRYASKDAVFPMMKMPLAVQKASQAALSVLQTSVEHVEGLYEGGATNR